MHRMALNQMLESIDCDRFVIRWNVTPVTDFFHLFQFTLLHCSHALESNRKAKKAASKLMKEMKDKGKRTSELLTWERINVINVVFFHCFPFVLLRFIFEDKMSREKIFYFVFTLINIWILLIYSHWLYWRIEILF